MHRSDVTARLIHSVLNREIFIGGPLKGQRKFNCKLFVVNECRTVADAKRMVRRMDRWMDNPVPLEEAPAEVFAVRAVNEPADFLWRARLQHEQAHRYIIESCHHKRYEGIDTGDAADVSDNDYGLARSSSATASPRPRAPPTTPPRRIQQPRAKVRTPFPKERASPGDQVVSRGTYAARLSVGTQPCSKQRLDRASAGLRTCPKPRPLGPHPAASGVVVVDDDVAAVDTDVVGAGHNTDIDDRCDGSIDDHAIAEAMQKSVELWLSNPDGVPDDIDGEAKADGVPDDIDDELLSGDDYDYENTDIPRVFRKHTASPTIATAGIRAPSRAPRRQQRKRQQSWESRQHNRSSYRRLRHSAPADDEGDDDKGGDENENKVNTVLTMMVSNQWPAIITAGGGDSLSVAEAFSWHNTQMHRMRRWTKSFSVSPEDGHRWITHQDGYT